MTVFATSNERAAARTRAEEALCRVFVRCQGWAPEQMAAECVDALTADGWHPGPRQEPAPALRGEPKEPTPVFREAREAAAARRHVCGRCGGRGFPATDGGCSDCPPTT